MLKSALDEEEAAGTYNKMTMMTTHSLPKQYYDILIDYYRANVSYSLDPVDNATGKIKLVLHTHKTIKYIT